MEIYAHRGAHNGEYQQENTLSAMERAWKTGCSGVETDVQVSSDGVLFLFHGNKNRIVWGGKYCNVAAMRFSEIESAAAENNLKICRLNEALEFCRGKLKMNLEIKNRACAGEAAKAAAETLGPGGFILTSFDHGALRDAREAVPEIKTGILSNKILKTDIIHDFIFNGAADFLIQNYIFAGNRFLSYSKKKKIGIYLWTVNNRFALKRIMKKNSVIGIITDNPRAAIEAGRIYRNV